LDLSSGSSYRLSHATTFRLPGNLLKVPAGTDNKDIISNCLLLLNPLIIGLSGNRKVCSQRFTYRAGSVARPTEPGCLLAYLLEISWLCWQLSIGLITGNMEIT